MDLHLILHFCLKKYKIKLREYNESVFVEQYCAGRRIKWFLFDDSFKQQECDLLMEYGLLSGTSIIRNGKIEYIGDVSVNICSHLIDS